MKESHMSYIPPEESLIEYPCDFPIKVMCLSQPDLVEHIVDVVKAHDVKFSAQRLTQRPSANGKYTGVTCLVHAHSREQLDAIYQDLFDHHLVKMVL